MNFKKALILVAVIALVVSLLSIGGLAAPKKTYTFIFVPKLVHPWYQDVIDGMNLAVKEFKARGININAVWNAPTQADAALHTQKIEASVAKKPDGLAVSSLDPTANTPAIKEALKRGIPTICFDNDADQSGRAAFVGHPKNEPDGKDMADALAKAMNEEGEVAILIGSLGSIQHGQRVAGFKEELKKYPKMKVVAELVDNDDLEKAIRLSADALKAHPDLKGFYGANASAPIGAAKAVEAAGKAGKVFVVGQDDLPDMVRFMRKGIVYAMDVQRPFEMGYWSVYYLYALNTGHTIPELHETGSYVITAKDLAKYPKYKQADYQVK
ncbi:MAG: substrate-binding domain-containing protein [Bacillota bacterium]